MRTRPDGPRRRRASVAARDRLAARIRAAPFDAERINATRDPRDELAQRLRIDRRRRDAG
jgi:hypothetical protein